MNKQSKKVSVMVSVASVAALAALSGCSSDDSSDASSSSGEEQHLVLGTSGDFPPLSSLDADTATVVGFEDDMMSAVTESLGWTYEWSQLSFDGLIPAVQSGRIDAIVSGLYHTEARAEEVDFIDYMQIPLAVMTATEDAATTDGPEDLCGQAIAYLTASPPELTQLQEWSDACTAAGNAPIEPVGFPSVSQAVNAVVTGRVFGELEGDIVTLYIAETEFDQELTVAFDVEGHTSTVGLATAQDSPFADELATAIQDWVESDDYCTTAEKWSLTAGDTLRSCT